MPRFHLWLNRLALLCLFLVASFSISPQTTVVAQSDACATALPIRLKEGSFARVTAGTANNVRIIPSRKGQLLGKIPGGETFKVVKGSRCAEGMNWWQVDYNGLTGWTVEADSKDYWLEPFDPNKPEVLTSTNGVDYGYDDIHFELNPDWVSAVTVRHLGAVIADPNVDMPQPFAPVGIEFNFSDPNGKTLPLSLRVYSTADYIRQEPKTKQSFDTLRKLFVEDPGWMQPKDEIPLLSVVRQPKLFRARLNELSFANGSGYRFLTQTSFDVHPIANPIDYHYSGLTYDNDYYVVVQGTVTSSLLSNSVDPADYGPDFEKNFETYRDGIVNQLNKAKDEEFTPDLSLFDGLIKSLQVKGPNFKVTSGDHTQVHYGIIDFTVGKELAQDVDYQINLANWESMSPLPEHTCFSLQQNPLDVPEFDNQMCIFPAEQMQDYVKALNRYLAEKPKLDTPDSQMQIPVPYNGAVQVVHAQMNYLHTDELEGVGFVTHYAQNAYFIAGNALEYNFSGVTNDGRFIIYLHYNLATNLMPDQIPADFNLDALQQDSSPYYQSVINNLNSASSADFEPNLDMLDALVQSIHFK